MCNHRTNSAGGDLGELGTEEPSTNEEEVDADEIEIEKPWSDVDSSSSEEDNVDSDLEAPRKFGRCSMIIDSDSESENQLEDDEKTTYRRSLYRPLFPLPESCASTPSKPSTETERPVASPPEASSSRSPSSGSNQPTKNAGGPVSPCAQEDEPDAQPESVTHEELDGMANLAPVIQPEEDDGNRRSSGRMRKRIQVDSRCECDTEITAEEKEVGDSVMMCKARGCETVWVRATLRFTCRN